MPTTLGWRDEAIMMKVTLIRKVLMWKTEQEWTWSKKWFAATPKLLCFPKTGEGADEDKAQTQIGLKFSTSNFCMGLCLMTIILLSFGSTVGPKASRVIQSSRWWWEDCHSKRVQLQALAPSVGGLFKLENICVGPHCSLWAHIAIHCSNVGTAAAVTLQQRGYCRS